MDTEFPAKVDEIDENVLNADETFKSEAAGTGACAPDNSDANEELSLKNTSEEEKSSESSEKNGIKEGKGETLADVAETREDNSLDSNTEKDGGENNPAVRKELAKNIDEASAKKLQNATRSASDKLDESSRESYGHLNGETVGVDERFIIDKASLEEARSSEIKKSDLQKMITEDSEMDIQAEPVTNETAGEQEMDEFQEVDMQPSVIRTALDLYNLAGPSQMEEFIVTDDNIADIVKDGSGDKWAKIAGSVELLAAELCENLRMILEPTKASKLEGDYRTGKRLNMRRLIAYIASGYRKDAIWLRRTKLAQRSYQIMIAVDDSASMHDSNVKLRACQSVATIESALRRLEAGQLAICKFGKSVKMINDFGACSDQLFGERLFSELTFQQEQTDFGNLLAYCKKAFDDFRDSEQNKQMLIVVSDGRGVFADGVTKIKRALSVLHSDQVTVLFVAVDNGKQSLTDMKFAEFTPDGSVNMVPYLQKFPFPFYVVVRHINLLPATVGDAIRQWFELTAHDY